MKRLNRNNVRKGIVPNKSGLYIIYNSKGKPIYVGHSRRLRHRIQSYYQQDDFQAHPTKRRLRGKAAFFSFRSMAISKARAIDRKKKFRYNSN